MTVTQEPKQDKPLADQADELVQSIDERGKEAWGKRPQRSRAPGYIAAIIVNLIMLYIVNNLLNWRVPFLTSEFVAVQWLMNLSISATIVANILFLAYDPAWFRHALQLVLNALSLVVLYTFYTVFPFAFNLFIWEQAVRIGLIVAMVGVVIGLIVEFVQLFMDRSS